MLIVKVKNFIFVLLSFCSDSISNIIRFHMKRRVQNCNNRVNIFVWFRNFIIIMSQLVLSCYQTRVQTVFLIIFFWVIFNCLFKWSCNSLYTFQTHCIWDDVFWKIICVKRWKNWKNATICSICRYFIFIIFNIWNFRLFFNIIQSSTLSRSRKSRIVILKINSQQVLTFWIKLMRRNFLTF